MRAWRLPMILLLIAGLIAAIAVERDDDDRAVGLVVNAHRASSDSGSVDRVVDGACESSFTIT